MTRSGGPGSGGGPGPRPGPGAASGGGGSPGGSAPAGGEGSARKAGQTSGFAATLAGGLIGSRIGNFRIAALLGEGAMGQVYLGAHDTLQRKVAIKLLHPQLAEHAELVDRFIDEARIVSGIGHPALVQVFDFGTAPDGRLYSVMEYLEGADLEKLLTSEGPLAPARVARFGAQIADGLAAAHGRGVVHRDLKPANLFVTRGPGGAEQVKILDFGIAKLLAAGGGGKRTQAGTVLGTPMYLSPEQAQGQEDVDGRADMYSLGIVLYELLAGRPPFVSDKVVDLLVQQVSAPPPPLGRLAPTVPATLSAVVMRCLAKPREERYPDMAALRDALEESLARSSTTAAPAFSGSVAVAPVAVSSARLARWLALAGLATTLAVAGMILGMRASRGPAAGGPAGARVHAGASAGRGAAGGVAGRGRNPYTAGDPAVLASGAAIWTSRCARCHGAKGEGDGKETPPGLEPKSFADVRTVPGLLDLYRFEIIRRGVGQGGRFTMPSFAKELSEDETWKVVTFLETLSGSAGESPRAAPPREPKPPLDRALEERGAALYKRKCVSCHGRRGRGDGPAREYLGRTPSDLTRGEFKLRSTPKGQLPTEEDLFRTLTAGMGVGGMPSFARLPERDRWALVAQVKTLSPAFRRQKEAPEPIALPPRPAPSVAARARGRDAFRLAGCPKCHGPNGRGDGPKAGELRDSRGLPVRPSDLASPLAYIGGSAPADIYRTMMTGVGGTPMPQGADFFDEREGWDVVEYILSLRLGQQAARR